MFGSAGDKNKKKVDYNHLSLDDFSDDDSDDEAPTTTRNRKRPQNGNKPSRSAMPVDTKYSDNPGSDMQQRQQQLLQEQDSGLEMLAQSAERLGQMSMGISEELEAQNRILNDMEDEFDTASENLDFVTRQTKKFIKEAGGTQNCIVIVSLTLVVIFLLFLIMYF